MSDRLSYLQVCTALDTWIVLTICIAFSNRNGRNITAPQLLNALHSGLNVSISYALFLVVYTFILFGRLPLAFSYSSSFTTLDLHELARHNILEHDASMGHADAEFESGYAPTKPSRSFIEGLIESSRDGKKVAVADAAKIRVVREGRSRQRRGHGLSALQEFVAQGEWGLLMGLLGEGERHKEIVEVVTLRRWLTEERLPGDRPPERQIGFVDTQLRALSVREAMSENRNGHGEL